MSGFSSSAQRVCRATMFIAACVARDVVAQQPLTPATIAAQGLPLRADTLDGFGEAKDTRNWFGFYVYAVSRATVAGKTAYFVTMNYTSKEKGSFQSDTLALDATTLAPLWRRFHARTDSASVTFSGRHATGWSLQNDRHMKIDYELPETSFAGSMLRWALPKLPLAAGYQISLSTFSIWKNAEDKGTITVKGAETIDAGGKKYDAWLLESSSGGRTWVEKSTGQIVQVFTPDSRRGYWLVKR